MKRIKILWERYKLIKELKNRGFVYTFDPLHRRHRHGVSYDGVSYDRDGVSIFIGIISNPMRRSQLTITIIDVFDYRTSANRLTNTAEESIKFVEETLLTRKLEML